MTIGDVFSVVAAILGIFLTAWATIVVLSLLMPGVAERAYAAASAPKRALGRGVLVFLPAAILGSILLGLPLPVAKLAGWVLTLAWMSLAAVGACGIAQAAARRVQDLEPSIGAYGSLCRGAAFVVGAGILPILGWFALAPLMILTSIGAGWSAVFASRRAAAAPVV